MLEETCRFCKQHFDKEMGDFFFGNFVCHNCITILHVALKKYEKSLEANQSEKAKQ